jgi:hypothetical protein
MKKMFFFLILCTITLLFTACGNEGRSDRRSRRLQVQETEDGIEVLAPDGSVLIKGNQKNASIIIKTDNGNEGTMNLSTGSLAPNFPADIPILPDSTVTMNQVLQNGHNAIATFTTPEKMDSVIQFYEEKIPLKGWEPGEQFDLDNIVMLNGTRDKASLNISITSTNETTTINMARTESIE